MPKTSRRLPATLRSFESRFPEIWAQYCALRDACDRVGPLAPKTRELVKIGIEVARKRHGGLVAHITRARRAGASKAEIYEAILLAVPLVGMPDVLDAFLVAKKELG
jgi:AhpD family alkylhydroperoxidase